MTTERVAFLNLFAKKYGDHPLALIVEELLVEVEDSRALWSAFQRISEETHRLSAKQVHEALRVKA